MATTYNTPFIPKPDSGFRLVDGRSMWDAIVNANALASAYGITAAGTTQATATPLTAVINQIDASVANAGVNLVSSKGTRSQPYQQMLLWNNTANSITVYAAQGTTDTINGIAGATGISFPAGEFATFVSAKPGSWFSDLGAGSSAFGAITTTSIGNSGNLTFTSIGAGIVQKIGTNGRAGQVTLTGTTAVTVANTSIATSDVISFSLSTVGGTVGAAPNLKTITAATGFTVAGSAGDTSTYNYIVQATSI
jgi:hypothetical protein